jgi:four helix bundle protein
LSYKNLEIWQAARSLVIEIHKMTMEKLPRFELYEEGSQIRKSSKSIKSTIVEGYGRPKYQQDYIRFLTYAIASNDETINHLENLFETGSLKDYQLHEDLHDRIEILGKKLNNFIQKIEQDLATKKKPVARGQKPEALYQRQLAKARGCDEDRQ